MKDLDSITEWGEYKKAKKQNNYEFAIEQLTKNKIAFKQLSESHLRVLSWDYWPSTGLFIHIKTKKRGRGINNLLRRIEELNKEE